MDKFLVLSLVLVLQLGISKGNHLVTAYSDQNSSRTDKTTGEKVSYEISGIGRYEVHQNNASWSEARQICNKLGGNLTVIRSIFDEWMVKNVLASYGVTFVWLGLHEINDESPHWETGTVGDWVNVKTVTAWKLNIPMDKKILYGTERDSIEECGLFSWNVGVIPAPCAFAAPFICEYK